MTVLYTVIGRLVVALVRLRFRRQLRIAAAVAVAATLVAGYLVASREAEEG